jgi:hypothetical protein
MAGLSKLTETERLDSVGWTSDMCTCTVIFLLSRHGATVNHGAKVFFRV